MNVPIGISSYKRLAFLGNLLQGLKNTHTPLDKVYVFSDGDESYRYFKQKKDISKQFGVKFILNKHGGCTGNFVNIGDYFVQKGYDYYIYLEDDISISLDWYPYSLKILEKLKGDSFGLFTLYCGHNHLKSKKVLKHVALSTGEPLYGCCGWLLSTKFFTVMKNRILTHPVLPDRALLDLIRVKNMPFKVYVSVPSIVQHIGSGYSEIPAPRHRSYFYGIGKSCLNLL